MAEYAKDAAETETPWERWEFRINSNKSWTKALHHPEWLRAVAYRRKSQTITVNGFEVPAPLTTVPEPGQKIFWVSLAEDNYVWETTWCNTQLDQRMLCRRLIHTTKEAAIAHAKAMLGTDPSKE